MATITTIEETDVISTSRADINTNFTNLNSDKIETSVIDTDTALTANSDTKIATQKAVKAYVDSGGQQNASEIIRGLVEEATDAEVTAGTDTGGTGAKLFVPPSKLNTQIAALSPATDIQTFTSSGTWTMPTGAKTVLVEAIGGGGGGGGTAAATNVSGGGGGGGGYTKVFIPASKISSPVTITIPDASAGGVGGNVGEVGGNVTFGTYVTGYGGGGGAYYSSNGGAGGGGGGMAGVGATASDGTGGAGGLPESRAVNVAGYFGGGGGSSSGVGALGFYGGGGGGRSAAGGASTFGGGGGGGGIYNSTGGAGGISLFGGTGGAGANGTGTGANGSNGIAPGGGGGGAACSTATARNGGAGAKGQITVTTYF